MDFRIANTDPSGDFRVTQYSSFYNCSVYLKPLRRGGAVNTAEEEDDLPNELMNYESVCRAAPGFAQLIKRFL